MARAVKLVLRTSPMDRYPKKDEGSSSGGARKTRDDSSEDEATSVHKDLSKSTRESLQYLAQLRQQSLPDTSQPTAARAPIGTNRPVYSSQSRGKKVEFDIPVKEEERKPLPLHDSVFRPFNPADHPTRVNNFTTLEQRLLRLGLTCTYPAASFDRPMGNPDWSLKSILNSRYRDSTNPKVIEYAGEFVFENGEPAVTEWLTFDELNWSWGIRIMRNFHQRNLFKPKDKRIEDPDVIKSVWRGQRSEWFNGKDIYQEEFLSKAIYFQTKQKLTEEYERAQAAGRNQSRGRSTKRPLLLPSRPILKLRFSKPDPSPPEETPDLEASTGLSDRSSASYSEGDDAEMWDTYNKAQGDNNHRRNHPMWRMFDAGQRRQTGADIKGTSKASTRDLTGEAMDLDATGPRADQKSEEEEAAAKAAWIEKMRRASQQAIQTKHRSDRRGSSSQAANQRINDDDDDDWIPPATIPFPSVHPTPYSSKDDGWVPPATIPFPSVPPPPYSVHPPPQKPLTRVPLPTRWEKPLAKKKNSKTSRNVGGKERNPGMSSESEDEGKGGGRPAAMAEIDTDFDGDSEDIDPLASKRSRESAGSNRGDLKRAKFFEQSGKMEDVEEGYQSNVSGDEGQPEEREGSEARSGKKDKMEDEKKGG
ncbi:hypothetical protein TWF281_003074 [Arthrobotrys megalospora]